MAEDGVRKFSLTPMSRALVKNHPEGTMANYSLLAGFGQQFMDSLKHLDAAVLNSDIPFAVAHDGKHQFEYCASNPAYSTKFQAAMSDHSKQLLKLLLAKYDGFKSVQRMADVGGGTGTTIARIVECYPHIQGINFDLPHVVAIAPAHQGTHTHHPSTFDISIQHEAVALVSTVFQLRKLVSRLHNQLLIQVHIKGFS